MVGKGGVALLAPGLFVFLWSTGFIGAKFGLPYAAPLSFLLVRYLLVIGLMLILAWLTRAPWPKGGRLWLRVGVSGLLVHAVYLGGVYLSIANGLPVGVTSIIVGLQPLLTAVGAAALLSERIVARQWLGLVLGLCGTLLVVSARVHGGFGLVGLPAAFGALFGITAGTLYQKRFCPSFDYRTGAVIQFVPAAAVTGLALLCYEDFRVEWNTQFILALSWLCIVLSLGAMGLLNFLIRTGTATNVASLFYLVPPCTAVIAWLAFDEALSNLMLLGMALAVSGVYLSRSEVLKR
ncbi:MAG: DMT family transporter [Azonexaceae bacterium]|nr:DMT family transporter [Azonexaceae bacterium]